jgi:iron complex transport system ATP-binding protein
MTAALELSGLCAALGGRAVLKDIGLRAGPGEFIGLIGPNGAGKSTLLRAAAGLIPAEAGSRLVQGTDISAMTARERARRLSYLPQSRPLYWSMPARSIVALGRFAYGNPLYENAEDEAAVARALTETGAAHLAERPAGELSGGEIARIHLARALAGETALLLADEPVAALDPAHQIAVMALLRGKADAGRTVIAALHELTLAARYCTRLVVLSDGRIAFDGAPEAVPAGVYADIFRVTPTVDNAGRLLALSAL